MICPKYWHLHSKLIKDMTKYQRIEARPPERLQRLVSSNQTDQWELGNRPSVDDITKPPISIVQETFTEVDGVVLLAIAI